MIDLTGMPLWQWISITLALGIASFFGVHYLLDRLAVRKVDAEDEDFTQWVA